MDAPPDLEITITDIMNAGHCARLGKFFRDNDLAAEYRAMIKGGSIPASKLIATGDPRALRVAQRKIDEAGHG